LAMVLVTAVTSERLRGRDASALALDSTRSQLECEVNRGTLSLSRGRDYRHSRLHFRLRGTARHAAQCIVSLSFSSLGQYASTKLRVTSTAALRVTFPLSGTETDRQGEREREREREGGDVEC